MTGEGILVRDCMREKIHRVTPYVRKVESDEELLILLRKKLLEECGELLTAPTPEDALEEMGDVLQVLRLWSHLIGYNFGHVERARQEKWRLKGGFGSGMVLAWKQPEE